MTTLRKHRMTTGCVFLGLAAVCFLSVLGAEPGERRNRLRIATLVLLGFGLTFLVRAVRTSARLSYQAPMDALPPGERLQRFKKLALVGGPAWLVLAVWTDWNLYRLHTGQVGEVRVWAPVVLMDDLLGPWPTAVFVPALGILVAASLRAQWLRAKRELEDHGTDPTGQAPPASL